MALYPQIILDSTVALGIINENNEKKWLATGFLYGQMVSRNDEGVGQYSVFLITNKHVFLNYGEMIIKFNNHNKITSEDYLIKLKDDDGKVLWVCHDNQDIDVAVLPLNIEHLINSNANFHYFPSDMAVIQKNDMINLGIIEGDFVLSFGYPMGNIGIDKQYPIVRNGTIARIKDYYESKSSNIIIDSFTFPGNSGGPVVIVPVQGCIDGTKQINRAGLIGMVKAFIPYSELAISQQTGRSRISFEENSGLTIVEPIDNILETINFYLKRSYQTQIEVNK